MTRRSDREWEAFGRTDPYYGVLSQERFRRDRLTGEALDQFFATGRDHMDFVLRTIRAHLAPDFQPASFLDFGCGVGRCLLPLAAAGRRVVGLDVSDAMLDEARRALAARCAAPVELLKSDDALSALTGRFDLVHAVLVFQHIHPARGVPLFERLVERLADGGVGAVQVPYRRQVGPAVRLLGALRRHVPLLHPLANLAYGKPLREPLMEKNCYDLNALCAILQRRKCGRVHLEFQGRGDLLSALLFFRRDEAWVPYEPYTE